MKKLSIFIIFIFGLLFIIFSNTHIYAATTYENLANTTISRYISTLKSRWNSTEKIIAYLSIKKAYYEKQKKSVRYIGLYKNQVDTMITVINLKIASLSLSTSSVSTPSQNSTSTIPSIPTNTSSSSSSGAQIKWINLEIREWIYYATFLLNNTGSSKDYDIFVYTPSNNLLSNKQPLSTQFISGNEKIYTSSQNGYTITSSFQAETDKSRVQNIRSLVTTAEYKSKSELNIIWTGVTQSFIALNDQQFFSQAKLDPETYKWNYETYMIYVAKDNSEAFIVRWNQIWTKVRIPELSIKNMAFVEGSYKPSITFNTANSSIYKQYYFMPNAWSDYQETYRKLWIDTSIYSKFIQSMVFWDNKKYYTISGFPITFEQSQNFQTFFATSWSTANLQWGYVTFDILGKSQFESKKLKDGYFYQYMLLVSEDASQSFLIEYQQLNSYGN